MLTESPTCDTLSRYSAKRNLHHADFFCHAPEAKRVSIVGDFNNWNPNATPMIRQPDGQWMASLELSHGITDTPSWWMAKPFSIQMPPEEHETRKTNQSHS